MHGLSPLLDYIDGGVEHELHNLFFCICNLSLLGKTISRRWVAHCFVHACVGVVRRCDQIDGERQEPPQSRGWAGVIDKSTVSQAIADGTLNIVIAIAVLLDSYPVCVEVAVSSVFVVLRGK